MTPDGDPERDGVDRRRLIRILVVVGVGIPILIEAVTFAGLVTNSLGADGPTASETAAPADERAVGVGDELLPATGPTETVEDAYVVAGDDGWQFVCTVRVGNVTGESYELTFGAVETGAGRVVEGTASTGRIAPGGDGTVTGTWTLPAGQQPARLTVAIARGDAGASTDAVVRLGGIPVRR